jgi:peroxiredoxin
VRVVAYDIGSTAGGSLHADGYRGRACLVVDEDASVVVGATFVGHDVAELLHSATVAVVGRVPLERLRHAGAVVPHHERGVAPAARGARPVNDTGPVLRPGVRLPDLTLTDQDDVPRRTVDLPGGDPLVLHLHRGWFCPKDRTYLRHVLLPLAEELDVAYVRLVSVSVEPPAVQAAYRAGLDARWTFLSDQHRVLQAALDLRETTDTVHDPFVPTVVVTDPDLVVQDVWDGYWYAGRATAEDLKQSLRRVSERLRPDWVVPRG